MRTMKSAPLSRGLFPWPTNDSFAATSQKLTLCSQAVEYLQRIAGLERLIGELVLKNEQLRLELKGRS